MSKTYFKITLLLLLGILGYFIITLFYTNHSVSEYTPVVSRNSTCISCHTPMQGFADAHQPDKVTCIACHLGDNKSKNKETAHQNMVIVPGNLSNASQTCAKCHTGIDIRVKNSIMNTMSGIINIDTYVFNEHQNLDSLFNIHHLKNNTLAEKHLRNKCASCHLGNEKQHPNPISQKSRGGGCTACHLNYTENGKTAHQQFLASNKKKLTTYHPSLSLKITDNHCFGCHSRSGRIATNYQGWHETIYKDTLQNNSNFYVLEDKRVFSKQPEDIHHTKGLSCIDCHDSYDVMGDGNLYAHQENAVKTQCTDCHSSKPFKTRSYQDLNLDQQRIIRLRKIDTNSHFVYQNNRVLLNVIKTTQQKYLITKNTHQQIAVSSPSEMCTKDVHKNISCSSCHTKWSPKCISCHTSFDEKGDSFDLLAKKWVAGNWVEKGGDFLAAYPTLGVRKNGSKKSIQTFAPGMIMHLTKEKNKDSFHRLFAPVSAHTISSKGRKCTTCHNNPVALGYGRGKLVFTAKGHWKFTPKYPKEKDGLPKDAWIPFLIPYTNAKATRKNARPFTVQEQQKILRVSACLTCHKNDTKVTLAILNNFTKAIQQKKEVCVEADF